ncbi:RagB/SusD family nutrient uptake outer membrane protein [Pseudoflavitalea sp. G-6-1-2]|uniref:RagB/SusD family nutrient uptake outer membrane protein n=1 Tax=Pseudoflavitalea sp. G-6-1-2 TaxID=2728841 RepID=UPI00146ABE68|nr:RagB/SusD family nutrient uptake outer membrane protein [Pseudoflavitalea sp. G-6-1-2]NML23639.1 RagB/SusD family nutrient uptake outer membrane protein [Pseudoflavitalea sp. G-6-1-2]
MKAIHILFIAAVLFISPSCKKFLAQYSQNQTFIQSAADLDELLIGSCYPLSGLWPEMLLLDDDLEQNPTITQTSNLVSYPEFGIHYWQKDPALNRNGSLNPGYGSYEIFYKRFSTLNTILFNIPSLREKNEPENALQRIAGEAHFLRAYYYFLLVNFYGKPYNISTANTDNGVPLKITPEVQTTPLKRASVKEVYDQITSDLLDAEKELAGANETGVLRANQAAVQALLCRVYLYREEYEKAVSVADKVLQKHYQLQDLNNWPASSPFLERASAEIIFTSNATGNNMYRVMIDPAILLSQYINNYRVSEDLLGNYSTTDLRPGAFFKQLDEGDFITKKSGDDNKSDACDLAMIRLPELYLNKAEALAASGKNEEAIAAIQELRKKRFKPADLTDLPFSGKQLIDFIRDERRRELCFELHRWFDLRRYAVNSRFPYEKSIRHRAFAFDGSGRYESGYYELKPYSQEPSAWLQPIPSKEIEFNKGAITNEPRPDRPLIP